MRVNTLQMKRAVSAVLLVLLLSAVGMTKVFAQYRVPKNDIRQATASAKKVAVGNENVNPVVNKFAPLTAKSVVVNRYNEEDSETMWTTYDLQSLHFCSSRMYQLPNGKVGVVSTMSHLFNQSPPDRGTGYNFYNGVEWMEQPEERVESTRAGWPTIAQWGDNGEILISHLPLRCWTREVAGQGEWVYRGELPSGDEATWPRVATSGDHHNIIHVVADIQQYGYPDYVDYQFYFRSEDAENWTVSYSPLADVGYVPGGGFSGDDYTITANGHYVAILYSGSLTNSVWMFKSTNDGITWNARKVWEDPYEGIDLNDPNLVYSDTLYRPMNGAIVIDNNGVAHVALNTFEMAHFADTDLGSYTYWSGRAIDGILYWNDTYEGPIESEDGNPHHAARLWWPDEENPGYMTMHNDPTKWIGYIPMYEGYEWNSDQFYHEGRYHDIFYGASGHPTLSCDPQGNLACAFSSPCVKRTNGEYYYRSIYVSYRNVENGYWEQMVDELTDKEINSNFLYSENIFTISAPNTYVPGEFWFGFQSDNQIGLYIADDDLQTDASENYIHAVKFVHIPGVQIIRATANPAEGGTVTGSGTYEIGQTCTLIATPNEDYAFVSWTENSVEVSTDASYSFTVTGDRNLVANFRNIRYNVWVAVQPEEGGSVRDDSKLMDRDGWLYYDNGSYYEALGTGGGSFYWGIMFPAGSYEGNIVTTVSMYDALAHTGSIMICQGGTNAPGSVLYTQPYTCTGIGDFVEWSLDTPVFIDPTLNLWIVMNNDNGSYMAPICNDSGDMNGRWISLDGTTWKDLANYGFNYTWMLRAYVGYAGSLIGSYLEGETCTLTATPNEDYAFVSWTENNEEVSTDASYSFTVTGDRNLVANFRYLRYEITAIAIPEAGGTISGSGSYLEGETCTLTATPADDFAFVRWTENDEEVSTDASYSFTVTGDRNLVAKFTSTNLIVFADPNVEAICVANWDTDGDGVLSYDEAAAVTDLGYAFRYNTDITSFDELQYFTGLSSIGSDAFRGCSGLTLITLPDSLTNIGTAAFQDCSGLTSITIPTSITSLFSNAFLGCSGLTAITIPELVTYIGGAVFRYCDNLATLNFNATNCPWLNGNWLDKCFSLSNVIIGENVQVIPDEFVSNCTWLTSIILPESVISIGIYAFYGCYGLTGNFVIPDNVVTIGDHAFYNCYGLEGIVMGNSVKTIGSEAFRNCSGLRGELTLPESLQSVGPSAFAGCNEISTVNYNAINCTDMGNVSQNVFADCLSLTHIRIGANVESIPNYAFKPCFLVTDMSVAAEVPPTIQASTFGTVSRNIPVSVPYGSGEAYRTAQYWKEFFHITEDYSPNPYTYHWNVNVHQFADNMTVTGIIQIEGVEQAVPYLEIGAFCNGECRGRQLLTYYPQVDRHLVFLMLYGEEGDMFSFKLYDHEAGEELTAGCASVLTFEADAIVGSFLDPYVFNFSDMQLTQFSEGWNWWSTYVEQTGIDGLSQLEESLGDNGITIRSQVGYTDYYEDYGWYGSLSSINNESSYKIKTSAPCVAEMAGGTAIPSLHPITLNQGWTWMGYLPSFALDINTALNGLDATQGDKVKSQQGYSDYYPGYGWFGSLNTIEPGMGLMYYSANSDAVTFTYPDNTRGGELKANLIAENNHWKPNVYAYPDNMTVMAVVELDDEELNTENYELAAFAANGECRGSVKLTYAEPLHRYVAFLTISGKDAIELSFRLYNTETNEEYYNAEESLDFVANAMVGKSDALYVVHFKGIMGMDEFANEVKVYPNPVNAGERFNIGLSGDVTDIVRVEIINTLGMVETVCTSSCQTLTAPNVAGVYILRITVEGKGTIVRKLVVK